MNMDWKKLVRLVLLLGAIAMLCYQSQKAVVLILAPPMMITSKQVDISEVPLPLMYLCPMAQYNQTKLEKHHYVTNVDILEGKLEGLKQTSWGSHVNMTIEELIGNVTDIDLNAFVENVKEETDPQMQFKPILFPKFGFCFDVQNYTMKKAFTLPGKNLFESEITILFTDKETKSYFSIDRSSQEGDKMVQLTNSMYTYFINIEMYEMADSTQCNPDPDYSFKQCVDDFVKKDVKQRLGCIPPFLSGNDHCRILNETYKENKNIDYYINEYVTPYVTSGETKAEKECKKPCVQQQIKVVQRDETHIVGRMGSMSVFTFNPVAKIFKALYIFFDKRNMTLYVLL